MSKETEQSFVNQLTQDASEARKEYEKAKAELNLPSHGIVGGEKLPAAQKVTEAFMTRLGELHDRIRVRYKKKLADVGLEQCHHLSADDHRWRIATAAWNDYQAQCAELSVASGIIPPPPLLFREPD
jgi:hypothetical protein